VRGLDIGTGASFIYPLIGSSSYGWSFIGSEIDKESISSAEKILIKNRGFIESLSRSEVRQQQSSSRMLDGILRLGEKVDFVMSNPPFFDSVEAFKKASIRKQVNLAANSKKRGNEPKKVSNLASEGVGSNNFGGCDSELWCPGGEVAFIKRLAEESCQFSSRVLLFSSLVSRRANLVAVDALLQQLPKIKFVRVVEMGQGQKSSWIVLWSFLSEREQLLWFQERGIPEKYSSDQAI
jgi:23S rRNA (adenine1618-N6)-methyltransferase